jgi:NAD(P)-dependent dehydrogenase (short-subunit alcohol dehydrogenase family)
MRGQPVAVISAGASGIGLTCARALAAEDYRVLTLDMDAGRG